MKCKECEKELSVTMDFEKGELLLGCSFCKKAASFKASEMSDPIWSWEGDLSLTAA